MFRFFFSGSPFSQAGRSIAKGSLFTGLGLIGFGMLVFILRDIFAFIAAAVFFMAGFSAIGYALKIYIATRDTNKSDGAYRKNVQIHTDDDFQN